MADCPRRHQRGARTAERDARAGGQTHRQGFRRTDKKDGDAPEEDREEGIKTWPVLFGKENSAKISILILLLSSYLLAMNENIYKFPLLSSLFELQNFGSIIYAQNLTQN